MVIAIFSFRDWWSNNFFRENFHRDAIAKPIQNCDPNDLILISDADEIPNFESLMKYKLKKFALLSQRNFYYKLNLQSKNEWLGTSVCFKKYLKSPQWLRNKRFLRRGFLRRIFNKTQFFIDQFNKSSETFTNAAAKFASIQLIPRYLLEISLIIFVCSFILISHFLKTNSTTLIFDLSLFLAASLRIIPSLNQLIGNLNHLRYSKRYLEDIHNEIIENKNNIENFRTT